MAMKLCFSSLLKSSSNESPHGKTCFFAYTKTKAQISVDVQPGVRPGWKLRRQVLF